jgi:hypothetical protein
MATPEADTDLEFLEKIGQTTALYWRLPEIQGVVAPRCPARFHHDPFGCLCTL